MNPLFKRKILFPLFIFFITGSLEADILWNTANNHGASGFIKDNQSLKQPLNFKTKFSLKKNSYRFYSLGIAGFNNGPQNLSMAFMISA